MQFMPIDKEIFALATALIEAYGNEAIRQAAVHANECESAGDVDDRKPGTMGRILGDSDEE